MGEVVVYDVESTGTDTTQDRIIQIAAMRIDKDGNEIERFDVLSILVNRWAHPNLFMAFQMNI